MSLRAIIWALEREGLTPTEKLLAIGLANFVNERNCSYPSSPTLSRLTKLNLKTVRSGLDGLERKGAITDTGERMGVTSQVKVYQLNIPSHPELGILPNSSKSGRLFKREKAPNSSPKGTQKRVTEPVRTPSSKTMSSSKAHPLPEHWSSPAVTDLPPVARALVEQWPRGAYEAACVTFKGHWLNETRAIGRKMDWGAALANWLVKDHAKYMSDGKRGVSYERLAPYADPAKPAAPTEPVAELQLEDGAGSIRVALRKLIGGRTFEQWFEPVAFLRNGSTLQIVVRTPFSRDYIENTFASDLRAAALKVGWTIDAIVVVLTAGPRARKAAAGG